ncbi:MAG: hypothetical protein AAGF90_09780, partial [Pseudomonadota bacterium]
MQFFLESPCASQRFPIDTRSTGGGVADASSPFVFFGSCCLTLLEFLKGYVGGLVVSTIGLAHVPPG